MPTTPRDDGVLDNPVWWALIGRQQRYGTVRDRTATFDPDVAPFAAFEGPPDPGQWSELARMAPGHDVVLMGGTAPVPSRWAVVGVGPGVQMVCDRLAAREGPPSPPGLEVLGAGDVADMLALVDAARPGPFRPRTCELGRFIGVRDGDRLVAMAGERLRPPGYVEVSAVATHPDYRGRGLAGVLVREVVRAILEEGEVAFLSAAAGNGAAIRLYEQLGFRFRRELPFRALRPPTTPG